EKASVRKLVFSPDGKRLAACFYPGPWPVCIWDVASGQRLATIEDLPPAEHLAFSADGKVMTTCHVSLSGNGPRVLTRWDAATGRELGRIRIDALARWRGGLSPDGRLLAHPFGSGNIIHLFDTVTAKEVCRTEGDNSVPALIVFSGDG